MQDQPTAIGVEVRHQSSRRRMAKRGSILSREPLRMIMMMMILLLKVLAAMATEAPQLNGRHFTITALEEPGFLDILDKKTSTAPTNTDNRGSSIVYDDKYFEEHFEFSGYLIDMLAAIAQPHRANFTYTLKPPSGYGSMCVPSLGRDDGSDNQQHFQPYDKAFRTQYNCGASDVHDATTQDNTTLSTSFNTDVYLGMYYVTPARQLINQFTIPFVPPFSGTLAMFGTATGIPNFEALLSAQQQKSNNTATEQDDSQNMVCGPGGTALIESVAEAYPGLKIRGIFGDEQAIYQTFYNETCQVYITDGPIAAQFVLRRSRENQCFSKSGKPIGVIGDPMPFGLSHYAIGIRQDVDPQVTNTLNYWMSILMTCNPLDEDGPCPDGNFNSMYQGRGGTGEECGYVLFPPEPSSSSSTLTSGGIAGVAIASAVIVLLAYTVWHLYQVQRQRRKQEKRTALALAQAEREREFNEYMAHEVRNPLASALAALSFVSSKTSDENIVPDPEHRALIQSDVTVMNASLQFVNQLLRNLLDLHRTGREEDEAEEDAVWGSQKRLRPRKKKTGIQLNLQPTDILRDVLEPISNILFMRGADVQIEVVCPKNLCITTDRIRLKQILLNLANNATKFVEKGFIRLRAEVISERDQPENGLPRPSRDNKKDSFNNNENGSVVRRRILSEVQFDSTHSLSSESHERVKSRIVLSVEDSGPGIPQEKREQLFVKFQDSLDLLNQGTGIGLHVCKNLSSLLGYTLSLDNDFDSGVPGSPGTRFTLDTHLSPLRMDSMRLSTIIREEAAVIDKNGVRNGALLSQQNEDLPEDLSVLFVDDDMLLRKMFSRVLKVTAPSWRIQEASNGETALKIVENEDFDLIFLDQYMAAVEKQLLGTETVAAMRAKGVKSIICGLSANDMEVRFKEVGANAFMSKPFPCQKDRLKEELLRFCNSSTVSKVKARQKLAASFSSSEASSPPTTAAKISTIDEIPV